MSLIYEVKNSKCSNQNNLLNDLLNQNNLLSDLLNQNKINLR